MIDPVNSVASSSQATSSQVTSSLASSSQVTPDPRDGGGGANPAPVQTPQLSSGSAAPLPAATPAQALRMTVEPYDDGTGFTYRFYDRVTGELVMELPPDKAAKLGESANYSAGQLVSQTA